MTRRVTTAPLTHRQAAAEFRTLLDSGYTPKPDGRAQDMTLDAWLRRYLPRARVELFGVNFYLSAVRRDNDFRFFVAFVVMPSPARRYIHPRIFYKDSSLIWRSASHYINTENEHWIGKGDLKPVIEDGREIWYSAEETTNLPFEMQGALDTVSRETGKARNDRQALELILRNAPEHRVAPYKDFSEPRRLAMATQRIYNGKPVAWFADERVPESLRFARGFEPDFDHGILDRTDSRSTIYGGDIAKYRVVSTNREIQYLFVAAPAHVWIVPPQSMSTELSSYGVRTIDVEVDERLCIAGFEFHYIDHSVDPPALHSQIPEGYAGPPNHIDPGRADVSPWNERLPVIAEFRRKTGIERQA